MKRDGMSDDPTHSPALTKTDAAPGQPRTRGLSLPPASGYELGEVIGRGGMGEVLLARDRKLGRDVAIKRMLVADPSKEALARFLREAQIQARLDHPAVVPVHELGYDSEGRPYFTMKRLAGTTLQDVLADATMQRLLRAFADVCLAIELAHTRGIVHRDLKPSNIMLGDYGEVYVLDWGIARVIGDAARDSQAGIPTLEPETQAGYVFGTPGYMAPEQARGEEIGPAADVYALGCILFEILAREALHREKRQEPSPRPSERRPDLTIPPELDTLCADATDLDPRARPPARALAERVQRYLDGDRDLEQRRTIASAQVERARLLLSGGDRAGAMKAAGRALALDPESTPAGELVSSLLLEPPLVLPGELERHLVEVDRRQERYQYRVSQRWQLAFLPFIPLLLWQGVTNWLTIGAFYAFIVVFLFVAQLQQRAARPHVLLGLLLSAAPMFVLPRATSPFLIAPGVLCCGDR
jgi:serine/threonine protein kinase